MFRAVALAVLMGWVLAVPAGADYATGVRYWGRGDFTGAAGAFRPDAQAGNAEAQYMMGRLTSLGDGVPQDFVQAWVWFDRAARQGHSLATAARTSMEHILTPEQLALARTADQPRTASVAPVPPLQQLQQPVEGRTVVLVPRQGVVVSTGSARRSTTPARLVSPGPTVEGNLLASGDLPERVREVQRALMRAGYYSGPVDGALTPSTRQAIRTYQRGIGQPETGLLSTAMVEQLAEDDRIWADPQQAAR